MAKKIIGVIIAVAYAVLYLLYTYVFGVLMVLTSNCSQDASLITTISVNGYFILGVLTVILTIIGVILSCLKIKLNKWFYFGAMILLIIQCVSFYVSITQFNVMPILISVIAVAINILIKWLLRLE